MTPEVARTAMIFLSRADLKGMEVDSFMAVYMALKEIIEAPADPPEVKKIVRKLVKEEVA